MFELTTTDREALNLLNTVPNKRFRTGLKKYWSAAAGEVEMRSVLWLFTWSQFGGRESATSQAIREAWARMFEVSLELVEWCVPLDYARSHYRLGSWERQSAVEEEVLDMLDNPPEKDEEDRTFFPGDLVFVLEQKVVNGILPKAWIKVFEAGDRDYEIFSFDLDAGSISGFRDCIDAAELFHERYQHCYSRLDRAYAAISEIRKGLRNIRDYPVIEKDALGNRQTWGGAGLIITVEDPGQEHRDYHNDMIIVTPHADALSWLVKKLYNMFSDWGAVNWENKHHFLARLGEKALAYQEALDGKPEKRKDLLKEVAQEGWEMFKEAKYEGSVK